MPNRTWNLGFHLRSPKNWLNDPNGCCQFRGVYRVFYQYNHNHPEVDQKAWGQFSSTDLVHWHYEGVSIEPSMVEDQDGVYTGCCLVEPGAADDGGDLLRAFYTGNVICPGPDHNPKDYQLVYDGREANEISCESSDGVHFGPKRVLLRNNDYPPECSLHVRDPKVWKEDGSYHMLLGARHIKNFGMCLIFDSPDGYDWTFRQFIQSDYPFGYMWECPNIVQLPDGHEYLALSPQGLPRQRDRWQSIWQAGYLPLPDPILSTTVVDERDFVEWDHGHDFYAPQTFRDEAGRWLLFGWLGCSDPHYTSAPDGLSWWHCLTVPRVLTRDQTTGMLLQNPVPELEALHHTPRALVSGQPLELAGRRADIVLRDISGEGSLTLDKSFQLYFEGGRLGIRYLVSEHAAGRTERSIPLSELTDLRILVDGSVVEVYANGGSEVFSSRWFPAEKSCLSVLSSFDARTSTVWHMEDVMSEVYATAQAPDLKIAGRKHH